MPFGKPRLADGWDFNGHWVYDRWVRYRALSPAAAGRPQTVLPLKGSSRRTAALPWKGKQTSVP
jgi:hypothetical protein